MLSVIAHSLLMTAVAAAPLGPGSYMRSVKVNATDRSFIVHVPKQYDAAKPMPVVLILHGGFANALITVGFTGMNEKADKAGFIAVYPNGTGLAGIVLGWNAGMWRAPLDRKQPDDVKYLAAVLDDLEAALSVDKKRVYATGISNGGMMCYRLAAEMSDRIAAIAPVSGTMAVTTPGRSGPSPCCTSTAPPTRSSLPPGRRAGLITYQSLEATIAAWVKLDGCPSQPVVTKIPDTAKDGTTITKKVYGPGKDGAEVMLVMIEGGGHTWPGRDPKVKFLGPYTKNISANDMIWEFFERHPMKSVPDVQTYRRNRRRFLRRHDRPAAALRAAGRDRRRRVPAPPRRLPGRRGPDALRRFLRASHAAVLLSCRAAAAGLGLDFDTILVVRYLSLGAGC